jgi:hypothetical protein
LQILPAHDDAPRGAGAPNPFILEFPIKGSDLWFITNHRRMREHRRLTLPPLPRAGNFWAHVLRDDGRMADPPDIRWVQEWYSAPLGHPLLDEPSTSAAETLEEVEPEQYYARIANDGRGLRVPTDLDESICRYLDLSAEDRARFDRATFWLDMTSRQWNSSVSASFRFRLGNRGADRAGRCSSIQVPGVRRAHPARGARRNSKV